MQDVRLALRLITSQRWFSAAVVATLAFGIGLNTAAFTLVNAVLFRAVPFPDGDRLVAIGGWQASNPDATFSISWPDFGDYRAQSTSFEMLEGASMANAVLSEPGMAAERWRTARVTAGFFDLLRTAPILGRALNETDLVPGAAPVVVIGHRVWVTRYRSAPEVIGRVVRVDERDATIVGVMPEGFQMPNREDLWLPFVRGERELARDNRGLLVLGLLKPGTTIERASTDLDVIAASLATTYPDVNKDMRVRVQTFHERFNGGDVRSVFLLMLGAVGLVLLVACANVANMMLGRALTRQREMSLRAALGASRARLVRQLLVESLVLSAAGALIGLALAKASVHAFDLGVANAGKPSWIHFTFDYAVLGYCVALCVGSSVVFGLVPALRASRVDIAGTLKEGGRSGSGRGGRLSGTLVVAQFALALVLLAGAGLMVRSLVTSTAVNGLMPRQEVMTARVQLPQGRYPDGAARVRFFDDVLARLATTPEVTDTAVMSQLPGLGSETRPYDVEGEAPVTGPDAPMTRVVAVSPGYFGMFDLPVPQGRAFDDRDGQEGREAVVVTSAFASRHWPDGTAIGRRIRFPRGDAAGPWLTVIGVSADLVQDPRESERRPVVFVPFRQEPSSSLLMAMRSPGDVGRHAATLRSTIQAMDVDLALYDVRTFQDAVTGSTLFFRVFAVVFSVFGGAALFMAAVGLYAVMAQATARRTREIGIRVAIGATPARILLTVMRRGLWQLGLGLGIGVPLAFFATSAMRSLLFGVVPGDPIAFGSSAAVLISAGILACWLPAWRAARVPPMRALGHEDR